MRKLLLPRSASSYHWASLACIATVLCDEYSLREPEKACRTGKQATEGNQGNKEEILHWWAVWLRKPDHWFEHWSGGLCGTRMTLQRSMAITHNRHSVDNSLRCWYAFVQCACGIAWTVTANAAAVICAWCIPVCSLHLTTIVLVRDSPLHDDHDIRP